MKQGEMVEIFKLMAKSLEGLSQAEFKGLLAGQGKLVYVESKSRTQKEEKKKEAGPSVLQELRQAESREEAERLLARGAKLKADLLRLAKEIPVYATAKDNKQALTEKIIEAVVGSKLTERAIKDTDLHG